MEWYLIDSEDILLEMKGDIQLLRDEDIIIVYLRLIPSIVCVYAKKESSCTTALCCSLLLCHARMAMRLAVLSNLAMKIGLHKDPDKRNNP